MGIYLPQKLIVVQELMTNMNAQSRSYLCTFAKIADDNTAEEYDYENDRQNYIGAHAFKSKRGLASEWGLKPSTLRDYFSEWLRSGWVIPADEIRALDDNPTFENWKRKNPGKQGYKHYVVNVCMLFRLLDVQYTLEKYHLNMSSEGVQELLDFALIRRDTDMENPPVDELIRPGYQPRLLTQWKMVKKEGPPDKWEDLYEPKKESAVAGASAKVETRNTTKRTGDPKEGLSVTDHIISADDFAKEPPLEDQFPLTISYISDVAEDYVDVVFHLDDITSEGVLDQNSYLPEDEEEKKSYLDEIYGVPPKIARFNEKWGEKMLEFALNRSQEQ